ncbi:TatD family hydrolase [Xylariomycetidae sp. FL2044]|nr:TatD family hydrolase [Xylariomycetidae sp. FL2044]
MSIDLRGLPESAPPQPTVELRYADVAVTATAKEFSGIYRNKQYHPADFTNTLDRALAAGVKKVMITGMSLSDVPTNLAIARSRPAGSCFITIGVHPYHAGELLPSRDGGTPAAAAALEDLAQAVRGALAQTPPLVAAFGELGLDYDRLNHADQRTQMDAFRMQLDLCVREKWELPLFLHCRAAFDDFVEVMTPYVKDKLLPRRGLVHSFVGTREQMQKLVGLGLDVSVNGFSLRDREGLDMVAAIPLERLQIETDAPWGEIKVGASEVAARYLAHEPKTSSLLPPSKKKDKWEATCMVKERNESCMIHRVAYIVAGLKGGRVEEVADAAWRNSVGMFGLGEQR